MLVCSTMVFPGRGSSLLRLSSQQRSCVSAAIQTQIQVTIARDFDRRDAVDVQAIRQFRGNRLGRTFQLARELERGGHSDFAEGSWSWLLCLGNEFAAVK